MNLIVQTLSAIGELVATAVVLFYATYIGARKAIEDDRREARARSRLNLRKNKLAKKIEADFKRAAHQPLDYR